MLLPANSFLIFINNDLGLSDCFHIFHMSSAIFTSLRPFGITWITASSAMIGSTSFSAINGKVHFLRILCAPVVCPRRNEMLPWIRPYSRVRSKKRGCASRADSFSSDLKRILGLLSFLLTPFLHSLENGTSRTINKRNFSIVA